MSKFPTKEEQRARFWDLTHKMDAIRAKVAPLREKRDAHVNEAAEKDRKLMVEPGVGMYEAQQELAFLARGLANVGTDPALEGKAA